jgi:hypothetical protein
VLDELVPEGAELREGERIPPLWSIQCDVGCSPWEGRERHVDALN